MDQWVQITDEETKVYDILHQYVNIMGRTDGYTQIFNFFLVKGPNGATFTDSDADPSVGFIAAIEGAVANGAQVIHLKRVELKPYRENGAWVTTGQVEFDFKKTINDFSEESENALAQGRSQPKLWFGVACNGTASTTSYQYRTLTRAFHMRKRRHIV
jgi:hypothetical protein